MSHTYVGVSEPVSFGAKATPIGCSRCGTVIRILTPVSMDAMILVAQAFDEAHAECEESGGGPIEAP